MQIPLRTTSNVQLYAANEEWRSDRLQLRMKRDALQTFWKRAGIEPDSAKPRKPKPDLLAFQQSL